MAHLGLARPAHLTLEQHTAQEPATLIVGPSWIGDTVLAHSLIRLLKQRAPDIPIDLCAPAWSAPLIAAMPEVRRLIEAPFAHGAVHLKARYALGCRLRAYGYLQAYVLPNSWKSALLPFFARIPQRIGYRGEQRYGLLTEARPLDRTRLPMTVQRFVALGLPPGASLPDPLPRPALIIDAAQCDAACARHALTRDHPVLALCPGAEYGPAKRWPAAYYAEVARHFLARQWQVWLFGSSQDRTVCGEIAQQAPQCRNLTGQTALEEAIALLACAHRVLTNDSGLMHVAAALGRPLLALYGSSDPRHTPPLDTRARIEWLQLACSPCFERTCPLGHTRCLYDLAPARIIASLEQLAEPCAS